MPDQTGIDFPCLSCATSLQFKSAASSFLICPACLALNYQQNQNTRLSISKLAPVQEEMSVIRVATKGIFQDLDFEVIGRLQYFFQERYRNHWFLSYANGTSGWLGDWDGNYSLFNPVGEIRSKFEKPAPGKYVQIKEVAYMTGQIDISRKVLGEGELGHFHLNEEKFITLELYSTAAEMALANIFTDKKVEVFTGHYLEASQLNLQNLRHHHDWV
jgi:hypothetical protein